MTESPDEDTLSALLGRLRVRSSVWCRSEMSAPWGFGVPARESASFHLFVEGEGWVEIGGVDGRLHLGTGDLVILPTGRRHTVRDDPASSVTMLETILDSVPMENGLLRYGGDGPRTDLVCGGFDIEEGESNPLIASLPPVLVVRGENGRPVEWLQSTLDMLRAERDTTVPGVEAFVARLTDVVLTQALRVSLRELDGSEIPMVGPLGDRQVADALRLVHADPSHAWTVDELASKVSLSRSRFSARFRAATGESPMRYVAATRLSTAGRLLRTSDRSVGAIARACGYESESSLTRAFKRRFGVSPGSYRRTHA